MIDINIEISTKYHVGTIAAPVAAHRWDQSKEQLPINYCSPIVHTSTMFGCRLSSSNYIAKAFSIPWPLPGRSVDQSVARSVERDVGNGKSIASLLPFVIYHGPGRGLRNHFHVGRNAAYCDLLHQARNVLIQ